MGHVIAAIRWRWSKSAIISSALELSNDTATETTRLHWLQANLSLNFESVVVFPSSGSLRRKKPTRDSMKQRCWIIIRYSTSSCRCCQSNRNVFHRLLASWFFIQIRSCSFLIGPLSYLTTLVLSISRSGLSVFAPTSLWLLPMKYLSEHVRYWFLDISSNHRFEWDRWTILNVSISASLSAIIWAVEFSVLCRVDKAGRLSTFGSSRSSWKFRQQQRAECNWVWSLIVSLWLYSHPLQRIPLFRRLY